MSATSDLDARLRDRVRALEEENLSLRAAILLLHDNAKLVRSAMEPEPTYYALLTSVTAGTGLGLDRAMLFLLDDSRLFLRGAAAVGPADPDEAATAWRIAEAAPDLETLYEAGQSQRSRRRALDRQVRELAVDLNGQTPMALAVRQGGTLVDSGGDDLRGLLHLPTSIAAPIRDRARVCGVLYADNQYTERPLSSVGQLVFGLLADLAGRTIEYARLFEKIARSARTDSLTGLGHHGALMEALHAAVAEATGPLGFIMLDLDELEAVNDCHGHIAGDTVLVGAADRIRTTIRSDATAFRFGGDEFAVLLPNTDSFGTGAAATRLCGAIAEHRFSIGQDRSVSLTCSLGVACFPDDADTAVDLLRRADEALLFAKHRGKNRVAVAREL